MRNIRGLVPFNNYLFKGWFVDMVTKTAFRKKIVLSMIMLLIMLLKRMKHKRIVIDCMNTNRNVEMIKKLNSVLSSYSPTFYLPSGMLKMALGSGRVNCFSGYVRQNVHLKDGEIVSIDWYQKDFKSFEQSLPIIIFVPGLTSDSRAQYANTFCEYACKDYKFRSCIFNRRGYSRMPYSKEDPNPITWNKFEDLDQTIEFVHRQFPHANIYLAGASMGANHIQSYAGRKAKNNFPVKVKAMGCISSPYYLVETTRFLNSQTIIRNVVVKDLINTVVEHLHEEKFMETIKRKGIDLKKVFKSRTTDDFHEAFSLHFTDYKDVTEYKNDVSSRDYIQYINIPTLSVNSSNDKLVPCSAIPYDEIKKNKNFIQVMVGGGDHLEYFSTIKTRRWAYDLVLTYFTNIQSNDNEDMDMSYNEECNGNESWLSYQFGC